MKKIWIILAAMVLLCGCGAEETVETVADEWVEPVAAAPREIVLELPGETSAFAMESDTGRQYLGDGYEITVQTMAGGDLNETLLTLTGFPKEDLTVVQTGDDAVKRYEFAWVSEGELGERVGRGAVLDDGNYHYCLTVLQDADTMQTCQIIWSEVFHYFSLA